jgi:hypothetical protein
MLPYNIILAHTKPSHKLRLFRLHSTCPSADHACPPTLPAHLTEAAYTRPRPPATRPAPSQCAAVMQACVHVRADSCAPCLFAWAHLSRLRMPALATTSAAQSASAAYAASACLSMARPWTHTIRCTPHQLLMPVPCATTKPHDLQLLHALPCPEAAGAHAVDKHTATLLQGDTTGAELYSLLAGA